jgi:Domain of unknown function (DUF222)
MGTITAPGNETEALAMTRTGLRYLYGLDPVEMSAGQRERVLDGLEQADAIEAAVRGRVLAVFDGQQDSQGFGYQNAKALMVHGHRIDKKTADAHLADANIARDWPQINAALAEGDVISEPWVLALRAQLGKIPAEARERTEEILVQAARDGADLRMLAQILAAILAETAPPDPDEDESKLADRWVRLETTMDGAGLLKGYLSPVCAAMFQALLDSLNAKTGPGDHRTQGVRDHDAVDQGLRLLLGSGKLPSRNGQPVKALVTIGFSQLCQLTGAPALIQAWITGTLVQRAAYLAGNTVSRGDGGTWLSDAEIPGVLGDAMIIPVVSAVPDPAALQLLIELCIQYGRTRDTAPGQAGDGTADAGADGTDRTAGAGRTGGAAGAAAAEAHRAGVLAMLEHGILAQLIAVVSGPEGIASLLRTQLAGRGLDGPSLPLDTGAARTIPPHLRRLITLRDQGSCAWPGGCSQPACATEPHYADVAVMPVVAGLCWQGACWCEEAGIFSQVLEEGEERVGRLVSAGGAGGRGGAVECLLFEGHVGLQVDLGGGDVLVAEPQRDDGDVVPGVQ